MVGSTISSKVLSEVTLGTGIFLSPLTITSVGRILAPAETYSIQTASAIYVGTSIAGASIVNHNLISGALPAFDTISIPAILAVSALNLNNYGTIIGQSGVYLNAGGTVTNSGLIAGSDSRSAQDYGVRLFNATLINSGTVFGTEYGVTSLNLGQVSNSGIISGSIAGADLISSAFTYGGTLTNTGSIYSQHTGITASSAMITNLGTVTGESYGIHIAWGSTISNSGKITGGFDGVMLLNEQYQTKEDSTLSNAGSIEGGYFGVAINFSTVINEASGTVTGQTFGVGVGASGYLFNAGAIYGVNTGLVVENGGFAVNDASLRGGTIGAALVAAGDLTNSSAGYIEGKRVGIRDQGGYLFNAGTLAGATYGLDLQGGGIAVSTGQITSQGEGIYLSSSYSTAAVDFLVNSGTVYGKGTGAILKNGTVYNVGNISGGLIGVSLVRGTSLANSGSIYGQKYGVQISGGITENTGTIIGKQTGVEISHTSLFDSGTISGGTYAIAGQGFTLVLGAGEVFSGKVTDKTNTSVLDLNGLAFGTVAGLGTQLTGFDVINFEPGAQWILSGNAAGLAHSQIINGFTFGDTILLTGFTMTSIVFLANAQIELASGKTLAYLDINVSKTSPYHITASTLGTVITLMAPCFAAGTRILTSRGEVAVQDLNVGEAIITLGAEDSPIVWIGKRTIDLQWHPQPEAVQPVCIMANALAENVPERDLWVSPDHAIHIGGYLIPAKELLNHSNIHQGSRLTVTYYHIELARHAVIFAENAAVETYLDTGNRAGFENAGAAVVLHPDVGNALRHQQSCAPLLESGDVLEKIRARIARRAETPGIGEPIPGEGSVLGPQALQLIL